ncbi:hypothetical protein GS493_05795 [Rhodococcus hoagii]|nr:hypothetical protein [Prescottella equi]
MIECCNCGRVVGDALPLCVSCADGLVRDLLAVPGLVADMTVTEVRQARMSRSKAVGKSSETALPYAADRTGAPRALPLDQLAGTITTWARDLVQTTSFRLIDILDAPGLRVLTANQRGGRRSDPASLTVDGLHDFEVAAVWMAHDAQALRRHPAIDELHDEITDVVASVRMAVDRLPELAYKGACPAVVDEARERIVRTCGADLYAEKGQDWVKCRRCGSNHDVREINRAAREHVEDMLFTASELHDLLDELGSPIPRARCGRGHRAASSSRAAGSGMAGLPTTGSAGVTHRSTGSAMCSSFVRSQEGVAPAVATIGKSLN